MKILKREEFMHSKDLLDVIFLLGTLQMKKKQYMIGKAQAFFFHKLSLLIVYVQDSVTSILSSPI